MIDTDALVEWLRTRPNDVVRIKPATPDLLHEYIQDYYGYNIPRTPVCDNHCSPFDAISDAFFSDGGEFVWVGPRTGGKTLQAALLEHMLMTLYGDTVAHAGAIDAQALKCYEYLRRFFNLEAFRDDVLGESLMSATLLKNGAKVEVLPMTFNRLNSPHTRMLFLDEIELTTNQLINEARSIPMRVNDRAPLVIFTSSRKKAHGPMEDVLRTARAEDRPVRTWCLEASTLVAVKGGKREIKDIKRGDLVWSQAEDGGFVLRAVTWAAKTGHRATVVVTFDDGRTIRCTADHEIKTDIGWIAAGSLTQDRYVVRAMWRRGIEPRNATLPSLLPTSGANDMRVRLAENASLKNVRTVLQSANGQAEHGSGGTHGYCSQSFSRRTQTYDDRIAGSQSIVTPSHRSGIRGTNRVASRGLLASFDAHGYRSVRLAPQNARDDKARRDSSRATTCAWIRGRCFVVVRNRNVGSYVARPLRVHSVVQAEAVDVYDITVEETHNFLANGIVVHNCVFEIMERCPPERHKFGSPSGCGSCKIEEICREREQGFGTGELAFKEGPGRAARADGWMKIDDVMQKFATIEEGNFKSQWLSQKPDTKGLAYPMFDENIHVIDYAYNPNFPVVAGIDFGYTNPNAVVYLQPLANDDIVIFAEHYKTSETADELAEAIKQERWFDNTSWRVADSAAAGDRATLNKRGVINEAANKAATAEEKSSIIAGINLVRWALAPKGRSRPILYVSRTCVNTIREFGSYHHPDEKDDRNIDEAPVKSDDHAMDAVRYCLRRLYRGRISA